MRTKLSGSLLVKTFKRHPVGLPLMIVVAFMIGFAIADTDTQHAIANPLPDWTKTGVNFNPSTHLYVCGYSRQADGCKPQSQYIRSGLCPAGLTDSQCYDIGLASDNANYNKICRQVLPADKTCSGSASVPLEMACPAAPTTEGTINFVTRTITIN